MTDTMIQDLVTTDGCEAYTTSMVIAQRFDKKHFHVLAAYDAQFSYDPGSSKAEIQALENFRESNFRCTNYADRQGKNQRILQMTRDGFSFLVMGFTGTKVSAWKVRFLQAFNIALTTMIEDIPNLRAEISQHEKTIIRLGQERDSAMLALPAPGRKRRSDAGIIVTYAFVPGVIPGDLVLQPIYKHRDDATEFDMDMHRFKHCGSKGTFLLRTAVEILKKYEGDPDPLIQSALEVIKAEVPELPDGITGSVGSSPTDSALSM